MPILEHKPQTSKLSRTNPFLPLESSLPLSPAEDGCAGKMALKNAHQGFVLSNVHTYHDERDHNSKRYTVSLFTFKVSYNI